MASATGSHPDTGSSVRPLPGSSTTLRPAAGRHFSAPKMPLLTERGFGVGCRLSTSKRRIAHPFRRSPNLGTGRYRSEPRIRCGWD